ncbi:hypothetical protein GCM10009654_15130 [Streptomyces hebeiensis]|uniref:Uncharacterized protein n=1 Tax=Streptomyces hebeiensis TaxID=229486 RepID=A0ABP4F7M4_9ACTN
MPPDPGPAAARRAVSPLDHRIGAVTSYDVDTLWAYRDRGVLDEPHAHLVDQHRKLVTAESGVFFYRTFLNRLPAVSFPSTALSSRIDRTVDPLEEAAARDAAARR